MRREVVWWILDELLAVAYFSSSRQGAAYEDEKDAMPRLP